MKGVWYEPHPWNLPCGYVDYGIHQIDWAMSPDGDRGMRCDLIVTWHPVCVPLMFYTEGIYISYRGSREPSCNLPSWIVMAA